MLSQKVKAYLSPIYVPDLDLGDFPLAGKGYPEYPAFTS